MFVSDDILDSSQVIAGFDLSNPVSLAADPLVVNGVIFQTVVVYIDWNC